MRPYNFFERFLRIFLCNFNFQSFILCFHVVNELKNLSSTGFLQIRKRVVFELLIGTRLVELFFKQTVYSVHCGVFKQSLSIITNFI